LSAGKVCEVLETGKSHKFRLEQLPAALIEAEIVVMFVNPMDSVDPEKPLEFGGCFTGTQPAGCPLDNYEKYTTDLTAIWGKVIELCAGQPTILRATDL
jgi:hypothetical protein